MSTDSPVQTLIADAFVESGFGLEHAERLAQCVEELAQMRARAKLVDILSALRATVHGEALWRALGGSTSEPLEAAARRLHVNERVLRRHKETIAGLLKQRCPGAC